MTLTVAWLRKVANTTELVVASDSRLSSGGYCDACQKIFPLPREDACIAFAGDTALAVPIIHQVTVSMQNYKGARDRSVGIADSLDHVLQVVNQIQGLHKNGMQDVLEKERIATRFLFCGYSWKHNQFRIYQIYYDKKQRAFSVRHLSTKTNIVVVGDSAPRSEFLRQLALIKKNEYNYEPLKILHSMCKLATKFDTIGGVPQLLKLYKFGNNLPYAIKTGAKITLFGRPLLPHEKTHYPIINTASFSISYPLASVVN